MEKVETVDQVLARWRADEARVRSRVSGFGVASPAQVAGLSGLAFFDAIFEGRLPAGPTVREQLEVALAAASQASLGMEEEVSR